MQLVSENRCFAGKQLRYVHHSSVVKCDMHFSIFLPPQAEQQPVPVIFWLSGLTCTDQNFVQKAGAQRVAAQLGVAIVAPDTSPRGSEVPGDPDGHWSFGLGAGFYVDATQAPWSEHYHMHSYVRYELQELIKDHFPVTDQRAIMGHSMGGHGALTMALKHPGNYRSVSAFAPVCAPTKCPWGQTAFTRYLGEHTPAWAEYDACELLINGAVPPPIKVDQGGADEFLAEQLLPSELIATAEQKGIELDYNLHAGYDHSYFFIASFIEAHLTFHARHLGCL